MAKKTRNTTKQKTVLTADEQIAKIDNLLDIELARPDEYDPRKNVLDSARKKITTLILEKKWSARKVLKLLQTGGWTGSSKLLLDTIKSWGITLRQPQNIGKKDNKKDNETTDKTMNNNDDANGTALEKISENPETANETSDDSADETAPEQNQETADDIDDMDIDVSPFRPQQQRPQQQQWQKSTYFGEPDDEKTIDSVL
jgi:hypothetical protein